MNMLDMGKEKNKVPLLNNNAIMIFRLYINGLFFVKAFPQKPL